MATEEQQDAPNPGDVGVGKFLYRLALAGVGGLILAQEEISNRFRRPEGEGEPSGELKEDSSPREAEGTTHVEATIDRFLDTLNLPRRTEVDELNRMVDELTAKVEAIRHPR